jgi:hypothetical protein
MQWRRKLGIRSAQQQVKVIASCMNNEGEIHRTCADLAPANGSTDRYGDGRMRKKSSSADQRNLLRMIYLA